MARIITDKKFQEILKENFENLKYSINQLFLEDYITYDLMVTLYPEMDENEYYNIRDRKSVIEKIKTKVKRNLEKVGYKNLVENFECYKKAMKNFDDIVYYIEKETYNFGKENGLLKNPKDASDLIQEYEIEKELKKLSIQEICKLWKETFEVEYSIDYDEYVSPSTHISVRTDILNLTIKFNDGTKIPVQGQIKDFMRV